MLSEGHEVICCVRDIRRFHMADQPPGKLRLIEVNFLHQESLVHIPEDIDAAYYLIHSMSTSIGDFEALEKRSALNFRGRLDQTSVRQVIYLSGIINDRELSRHLHSRKAVEEILSAGKYRLTTLRAGIIIGSGSASFEIMRDLVEKLPLMIAPRWLLTKSQPIAIKNVIQYLQGVLFHEQTYGRSFDIGGPAVLTYREMLLILARVRQLRRSILIVPVMTPKLSSYWLYFITSTSYKLAVNLVESMKIEIVGNTESIRKLIDIPLISYEDALRLAFGKTTVQDIASHWTDALSSHALETGISGLINVPVHGCFSDTRSAIPADESLTLERIWAIGGHTGWYYADWLWNLRGFLDKIAGGVGLRRGRKHPEDLHAGDSLDFWRVLVADKNDKRLLLYAEMKLPGEAWLEFRIAGGKIIQTATFRPKGLKGRLYWYLVLPFHAIIFGGMIRKLTAPATTSPVSRTIPEDV